MYDRMEVDLSQAEVDLSLAEIDLSKDLTDQIREIYKDRISFSFEDLCVSSQYRSERFSNQVCGNASNQQILNILRSLPGWIARMTISFELCCRHLEKLTTDLLMEFFTSFPPELEELVIENVKLFYPLYLRYLRAAACSPFRFKVLDLSGSSFLSDDLFLLKKFLQAIYPLQKVNFESCNFSKLDRDGHTDAVIDVMSFAGKFKEVNLRRNDLAIMPIDNLIRLIKATSSVMTLDLCNNGLERLPKAAEEHLIQALVTSLMQTPGREIIIEDSILNKLKVRLYIEKRFVYISQAASNCPQELITIITDYLGNPPPSKDAKLIARLGLLPTPRSEPKNDGRGQPKSKGDSKDQARSPELKRSRSGESGEEGEESEMNNSNEVGFQTKKHCNRPLMQGQIPSLPKR